MSHQHAGTQNFRRQHQELLELATQVGGRLTPSRVVGEAAEVRRLLAQFAGKLNVHARMENDALYPCLMRHPEPTIRQEAEKLHREAGTVYEAFSGFLSAWPSAAAIEQAPAEFIRHGLRVYRMLGKRMLREETELYPLVERLDVCSKAHAAAPLPSPRSSARSRADRSRSGRVQSRGRERSRAVPRAGAPAANPGARRR